MDKIVTISRQYGSGGREIGQKLAQIWGIPFYDNELITRAAKESGFAETAFETAESRANNSLLYSIARGTVQFNGQDMGFSVNNLSLDDKIYLAQAKVIRNCAAEGPCVIVGRCADYILRKYDNVVNIFVYADIDFRAERAIRIDGMSPEKIENAIQKIDKKRSNYHSFHTGEKWGRIENYSLCINSGRVGIDNAVEVIRAYVEGFGSKQ